MPSPSERNIVIIGGGIIGCTTAYYLTRHPSYSPSTTTITLLEASKNGAAQGASGKAGGLVAKWAYPSELVGVSFDEHVRLAELHNGKERWGWRFVGCGSWTGRGEAIDKDAGDAVGRGGRRKSLEKTLGLSGGWKKNRQQLGLPDDLDWVKEDLTSAYSPMAKAGATAQVHPYLFTTSMLELAREQGVQFVRGKATQVEVDATTGSVSGVTYTTPDESEPVTIPATHVVVAAGVWSTKLVPTPLPIEGTRAHSITIQPKDPISPYVLFTEILLPSRNGKRSTEASPEIYARPTNEVYCCGPGDNSKVPETVDDVQVDLAACESIREHVSSISKQLREGEIDKDQICIQGLETTIGYVSWIGKYAERNAVLVDLLQEAGAVPFVRTNIPQTLMWSETFNSVFGRTLNPFNRKLTCGGSSGGEGALVGMKGSPLGVGSDVGGSIRIPSSFNGLYGLRPSCGRVPYAGSVNTLEGQDSIPSVLGPISNSLSGVKLFMQAVAAGKPWLKDPLARRAPWSDAEYSLSEHDGGKKLCFGIMWHNGHVVPHPPITRALEATKAALLAAGHEVTDWEPFRNKELYDVTSRIWTAASDEDYHSVTSLTGEPLINSMDPAAEAEMVQNSFLPAQQNVSAYQVWQNHKAKTAMRQEHMQKWNETVKITGTGRPVDAIITPAVAYVAPPHGKNYSAEYTAVWNALDYTACVFPVTKVDPVLDAKRPPHEFLNATDKRNYEFYDPETFWNAPVSLQLVGRAQEEEAVIAMTEIVDAALKGQVAPKL